MQQTAEVSEVQKLQDYLESSNFFYQDLLGYVPEDTNDKVLQEFERRGRLMGTRLNIQELREYLIDLYERFLSGEDIRKEAKKAHMDYSGASKFISKGMDIALGYLEDIGWEISPNVSHIKDLPKIHALKILKSLKKEEESPPKEWFRDVYEETK